MSEGEKQLLVWSIWPYQQFHVREVYDMQIDFECSGGFAHLRLIFRGNTENLPHEVAATLYQLVGQARFFDLTPSDMGPTPHGAADAFNYRVMISDGDQRNTLVTTDVAAPVTLHPLLAYLRQLAVNQPTRDIGGSL